MNLVDERRRHVLYTELERVHGAEPAETLMSLLPPDWESLATKEDLRVLGAELRGELAGLRGEFSELRGEMGGLRGEFSELRGEMGGLRGEVSELRGEMGGLRGEVKEAIGELHKEMGRQTRTIVFPMLGAFVGMAGVFATLTGVLVAAS